LGWDYHKRQVHLSIPKYVQKALKRFQHKAGKLQHAPYQGAPINYGAKKQYATQELKAPLLDDKAKRSSNRYAASFYSLAEQLIAPFFAQSAPLHHNHVSQLKTQCKKHYNSTITWPYKKTPYSPTMQAAWC
jgi:hypothetical protein